MRINYVHVLASLGGDLFSKSVYTPDTDAEHLSASAQPIVL